MNKNLDYTERQLLSKLARDGYAVVPSRHIGLRWLCENEYVSREAADLPDGLSLYSITDAGREALGYPSNWFVYESEYGGTPNNFHVARRGDSLFVDLTYPPRDDADDEGRVRYVVFDQESIRASDGIRVSYDYGRDGYVVEQPNEVLVGTAEPRCYDNRTEWTETAFLKSWACNKRGGDGSPIQDEYDRADAEHRAILAKKK